MTMINKTASVSLKTLFYNSGHDTAYSNVKAQALAKVMLFRASANSYFD